MGRMTENLEDRGVNVENNTQVSVLFDTVNIKIVCGDDYEAQVLFDDIVERINSGQGVCITVKRSK